MSTFAYAAQIEEAAPGEFLVTFRDVPEAITGGATLGESLVLAIDALDVAIEGILAEGRLAPSSSPAEAGEHVIELSPAIAARVALANVMASQSVSGRALAERMGKDEKNVRRILAGQGSLDATLQALAALGVRAGLSVGQPLAA